MKFTKKYNIKQIKIKNMKEVLKKYLNSIIRLKTKKNEYHGYFDYTLISVNDTYFVLNNHGITYEKQNYYIPYTSIFRIYEKESSIQIELHNFDDLIESTHKLSEELNTMKEEIDILKEKMVSMNELNIINAEINSMKITLNSISSDVSKLANATRFYR